MAASMDEYRHERLKLAGGFMRLLQIQGTATNTKLNNRGISGHSNDVISLRITQYAISRRPAYIAVSYTWGNAKDAGRVVRVNGRPFAVRQNLWTLLWHLRQQGESRFLWIDALCIDQKNLDERNFHVALMGRIYQGASLVIVWLGLPSDDRRQARALEFIHEMALSTTGAGRGSTSAATNTSTRHGDSSSTTNTLSRSNLTWFRDRYINEANAGRWTNLLELCRAAYWTRTWIIQEFLQASQIEVWCGMARLEWRHFEAVVRAIRELQTTSSCVIPSLVVQVMQSLPVRLTTRRIFHTTSTLEELITEFHDSHCTERRDKIYGILGIADDCATTTEQGQQNNRPSSSSLGPPRPDYAKHIVEVYLEVSKFLVQAALGRARSPLLAIALAQRSLGLVHADITSYVDHVARNSQNDSRSGAPLLLNARLSTYSHPLKPDYISVISEALPGWTSIRDLRQRLELVDWGRYVGHEVRRKPLGSRLSSSGSVSGVATPRSPLSTSYASPAGTTPSDTADLRGPPLGHIQTVRADLPLDMIDNVVWAAEHASETLKALYNIPTTTATTTATTTTTTTTTTSSPPELPLIPIEYMSQSRHDKQLHLKEEPHGKPKVIIESRPGKGCDPARIGFACTEARAGDLICQFAGLPHTLVVRRVDGAALKLVGLARMVTHAALNESGVHPRILASDLDPSARDKWSGLLERRRDEAVGVDVDVDVDTAAVPVVMVAVAAEDEDEDQEKKEQEEEVPDPEYALLDDYALEIDPLSWWEILR